MAHVFVTSTRGFALGAHPDGARRGRPCPGSAGRDRGMVSRSASGRWRSASSTPDRNVGAIVTPLIVPIIALALGWQMAFIVTGLLTLVWIGGVADLVPASARASARSRRRDRLYRSRSAEAQRPVPWRTLLATRQTWAYMLGRFLIDPVWWTFLFWLPDFSPQALWTSTSRRYGPPLVAIYLMADVGSMLGGWRRRACSRKGFSAEPRPQDSRCWAAPSAPCRSPCAHMPPIAGWRCC